MATDEDVLEAAFAKTKAPPDDEDTELEAAFRKMQPAATNPNELQAGPGFKELTGPATEKPPPPPGPQGAAQQVIQPLLRFGVGAAGALGELGGSVLNAVSRGTVSGAAAGFPDIVKFSARDYIHKAEHLGVLTEANFVGRTAELLGEGVVHIGSIVAGSGALQAAGYSAKVANAVSIVGASLLGTQQAATVAGTPFSAKDFAWSVGYTAAAIPLGGALGKQLVRATEKAVHKPLGQAMKSAIQNSTLATVFETQNIVRQVPDWKERWLAGALSFNLVATHEAMYPGETRPRTSGAARQSFDALEALNAERGLGTARQPTPEVARAEAKGEPTPAEIRVRIAQARSYAENQQARLKTLESTKKTEPVTGAEEVAPQARREEITGRQPATAEDLMVMFEIPQADAQRIASRKLTEAERQEVLGERETEAMLWEANRKGGFPLVMETSYRRGILSGGQEKLWEAQRGQLPEEAKIALGEQVPTVEEAVRGLEVAERNAFDQQMRAQPAPGEATFPNLAGTGAAGAPQQTSQRPDLPAGEPTFPLLKGTGKTEPEAGFVDRTSPAPRDLHPEAAAATTEIARTPMSQPEPSIPELTREPGRAVEVDEAAAPASSKPSTTSGPMSPEEVAKIVAPEPGQAQAEIRQAAERVYRALQNRTGLSDTELGALAVGGLTLGAYVGAQAAKDDETRGQWAQLAMVPALAWLGKGRKLSPGAKAEFEAARSRAESRDAERSSHDKAITERVEKALAKTDALIYTGKPGPSKAVEMAKELMEKIPESTASPRVEGATAQATALTTKEAVRSTVGSLRANFGKAGDALGRGITDAERVGRMREEKLRQEHNQMDTGPFGDRPNKPLSPKDQELLQEYLDWTLDSSLPKPDFEAIKKGSSKLRRELYVGMYRLHGERVLSDLSEAERATVIENTRFYDEKLAQHLKEGQDAGLPVQPLYTQNGRYWPIHHTEAVFDPPTRMRDSRIPGQRSEYYRKLDRADRLQKAMAKEEGVPVHVIREALRGEQEGGGFWRRRTIEEVIAKKFGSMDMHRAFSTTIGSNPSPSAQYLNYIEGAIPRMELSRVFGPNGEMANTILTMGERDGYSRSSMAELYDYATGQHPKYLSGFESWYGRGLGHVSSFLRMGALGRFVQPQFLQLLAPGMSIGRNPVESMKILWQQKLDAIGGAISMSADLPQALRKKFGNETAARLASNAGVGLKAVYLQEQAHVKSPFARATTMLLKAQGGTIMDRAARVQGAAVGDAWFKVVREMQLTAVRSGDPKKIDQSRQFMEEIFRDEPVLLEQARKTDITKPEEEYLAQVAAQNISDRWNHHIAPSTMPLMYSHPIGRHFYTLGTFQYRQTATFHRVMEDARRYPATRLRMAAIGGLLTGSGMLLLYTRRLGQSGPVAEDDPFWLDVVNGAAFSWFAPLYVNGVNSVLGKYANPVRNTVGPTHNFVWDLGENWQRSEKQGSLVPLERLLIRRGVPQHPIPGLPQPRDMILEEVAPSGGKAKKRRAKAVH